MAETGSLRTRRILATLGARPSEAEPRGWRHYLLLVLALAMVATGALHAHYNLVTGERYPYPRHMDEYVHWGEAQAIVDQGTINIRDPFTGAEARESYVVQSDERGYQLYLGVFQDATGIPWLAIFQFGPAAIAALLALALYALAERLGAGIEAAFLTACIPTTLRFLGPGFLVPIVLGCVFLVATLHLLMRERNGTHFAIVAFLVGTSFTIHAVAGLAAALVTGLYALLSLRRGLRDGVLLAGAAVLPALLVWDLFASNLEKGAFVSALLPTSLDTFLLFGWTPLVASGVGVAALLLRGGEDRKFGVVLLAILASVGLLIAMRRYASVDVFGLYDRSWMILYVGLVTLAAVGLASLRSALSSAARGVRPLLRAAVPGLLVAASALAAAGLAGHSIVLVSQQPYYQVMTHEDYEAFHWMAENLGPHYAKGVVEGLPSMPFSIITGRPAVYTHFPTSAFEDPPHILEFFARGGDTTSLLSWEASIVYAATPLTNPDLQAARDRVYLLREDYTIQMAGKRS